jgi:hypothetical protein
MERRSIVLAHWWTATPKKPDCAFIISLGSAAGHTRQTMRRSRTTDIRRRCTFCPFQIFPTRIIGSDFRAALTMGTTTDQTLESCTQHNDRLTDMNERRRKA